MKIADKVIVVTGGGNGIGRELVLQLLTRGARVAAVDVNEAALDETCRLAGARADRLSAHIVDITDKKAVARLVKDVAKAHGAIDGVINNAGIIQPFVKVNDLDDAAIERVMNVNFYGTLYMTRAFLPLFLERPEAHIVNISSMGGFLPVPGQSVYGASKAAVKLLTEGLHSELADTNVRVTVVFPGAIGTEIAANSGVSIAMPGHGKAKSFKPLAVDKAARTILDGVEKNRYRVLVGPDAKIMDALYRANPKRAARFIYKQMRELLHG